MFGGKTTQPFNIVFKSKKISFQHSALAEPPTRRVADHGPCPQHRGLVVRRNGPVHVPDPERGFAGEPTGHRRWCHCAVVPGDGFQLAARFAAL